MQLEKLREKREMTFNPFTTNFYTASFFLKIILLISISMWRYTT